MLRKREVACSKTTWEVIGPTLYDIHAGQQPVSDNLTIAVVTRRCFAKFLLKPEK